MYDVEHIEKHYETYELQNRVTDIVLGIIDQNVRNRMHARSLTDEILSSLEIEGEKISYDTVYSSLCNRPGIDSGMKVRTARYTEDLTTILTQRILVPTG